MVVPSKSRVDGNNSEVMPHLSTLAESFTAINNELKQIDRNPEEYWYAMGARLHKLLKLRLYREGGFHSFSDYCARGLGYSRQHAYKLIKVTQFVNELWQQAQTDEHRASVQRLTLLGFTKLYLIHLLPTDQLYKYLKEGVPISTNISGLRAPLEEVTIGQLKRIIGSGSQSPQPRVSEVPINTVVKVLKAQAGVLVQLVEQCRQENEPEKISDQLKLVDEYAQAILNGISALGVSDN